MQDLITPKGHFSLQCFNKDGEKVWQEDINNVVLNVGKNLFLDVMFGATAKVTTWHLGLSTDPSTIDAAAYSLIGEVGTRQATSFTRVSQTIQSDEETFTGITATVRKAFLVSASTSGILFGVTNLSTPRVVVSTDNIKIVYSVQLL